MKKEQPPSNLSEILWNAWCIVSVIGIWPRYIEPNIIQTTKLNLTIPSLSPALNGFKVLQFSDLHFHPNIPTFFIRSLIKKVKAFSPDMIVFTGDFLCKAIMQDKNRLKEVLSEMEAPQGCYAILGNHDYEEFVTVNLNGEYDVQMREPSDIIQGFLRLLKKTPLKKVITAEAQKVGMHQELLDLLKETPFQLLNNKTTTVPIKDSALNVCGLGEYTLGRCKPEEAFKEYDTSYPGIILTHNPDSVPLLKGYPGEVILCGHTHGGQVNLPWMWKRLTKMENMELKRGLKTLHGKKVYINRGLGSVLPFRWFSPPEVSLITLST